MPHTVSTAPSSAAVAGTEDAAARTPTYITRQWMDGWMDSRSRQPGPLANPSMGKNAPSFSLSLSDPVNVAYEGVHHQEEPRDTDGLFPPLHL
mmetsp:Transcript_8168/g.23207  ORF Transcript_8168/g.23207 Transcript_8168/m.23207 type:complete len:93 (+) Transcript_8168:2058-2336(+)